MERRRAARVLAASDAFVHALGRRHGAFGAEAEVGVGFRILGFGKAQRGGSQLGGADFARKQGLPHAVDGQGGNIHARLSVR
jgi:hypothetical protein